MLLSYFQSFLNIDSRLDNIFYLTNINHHPDLHVILIMFVFLMFYLKVEKVFVIFTKAFVKFFPIYFGEKIFSLSALVSKYFTQKKYKKGTMKTCGGSWVLILLKLICLEFRICRQAVQQIDSPDLTFFKGIGFPK